MVMRPDTSRYMLEPKNRHGTKRIGCCPSSTLARMSGRRSRKMSQPCGIKSSSDRPRSYCATTWRPASSMMGSACCHMASTGAHTASRRSRYDRRSAGDSRSLPRRRRYSSRSSGDLRGHLQVERDRGHCLLDGGPQHIRFSDTHRVGVLGEHLHLGEAALFCRAVVPEVADAVRKVLPPLEHLGQLRIPGLHGGAGGHVEEPGQIGDQGGRRRHQPWFSALCSLRLT